MWGGRRGLAVEGAEEEVGVPEAEAGEGRARLAGSDGLDADSDIASAALADTLSAAVCAQYWTVLCCASQ